MKASQEFKRAAEAELRRLTEAPVSNLVDSALGHISQAVDDLLMAEGQLTRDQSGEGKRAQAIISKAASRISQAGRTIKGVQSQVRGLRNLR